MQQIVLLLWLAIVDIHPYFVYWSGKERINHSQRATYLADAIKNHPTQFDSITQTLEAISTIIQHVLAKHLPDDYDQLRVFCELLPLNHLPATYPFPGFVLNLQVCTQAHVDSNDDRICVVIPFGAFRGGELVLHEMGLVIELQEGDIVIFPSSKLTHFNLHFTGVRGSVVMHSDKEVKSWIKDRNGWDKHMVV